MIRHSPQEPDPDGVLSGFKYVIDALVDYDVLEDDRISNLDVFVGWKRPVKGGFKGVEVALFEIGV